MALFEEQITDTLTTDAPSIKYEGDQGPQSPQDERMAQLKNEYMQYVFEMKDIGEPIMSFEEWYQAVYEASKMGVDAGQQPQQPQQPQPQMMRQPVAYGGIMDLGGRRRYGWGSKIKKRIRKLIPNEAAKIAEVAAPFVAPFNPLAAGLMSGIGGFDRHGSIGKGLKSGLLNYGMGQGARYLGGADLQKGLSLKMPGGASSGIGQYFSKPTGSNPRFFDNLFKKSTHMGSGSGATYPQDMHAGTNIAEEITKGGDTITEKLSLGKRLMNKIDDYAVPIMMGAMGLAGATAKPQDMKAAASRGEGLDIDSIREEVRVALADPSGEKWTELQKKYPYMGEQSTKKAAEGGRAGYYAGGQSTPSDYTVEDAMMTTTQDKLGGITDVMKQADLFRQGGVGQMYAADGGRIGYNKGGNYAQNEVANQLFGTSFNVLDPFQQGQVTLV